MNARELLLNPIAFMPPPRILDGLTPGEAEARVPGATHSIVEILAHVVFWQSWILDRCSGVATPMAGSAAEGWPAASGRDWESLTQRFTSGLEAAVQLATDRAEERIEPAIEFEPLGAFTIRDAVTHIAIHNAHHLGQIVTLRQIGGAWPPPDGSWTW